MNRYLIFAGHNYYPNGGWEDFIFSGKTMLECQTQIKKKQGPNVWEPYTILGEDYGWYHIVDFLEGEIVEKHEDVF